MAFRLTDASSSLWPPDRKVMPKQEEHECLAVLAKLANVCNSTRQYCVHPAYQ